MGRTFLNFYMSRHHFNMDAFKGKYTRTYVDKFEDLLEVLEVNYFLRKAASASTPVMEVFEEKGAWTIKTSTILKSIKLGPFLIGQPFDVTTADGREVTATVTVFGNTLVETQKAKEWGVKTCTTVREFNGDDVVMKITVDGNEIRHRPEVQEDRLSRSN